MSGASKDFPGLPVHASVSHRLNFNQTARTRISGRHPTTQTKLNVTLPGAQQSLCQHTNPEGKKKKERKSDS